MDQLCPLSFYSDPLSKLAGEKSMRKRTVHQRQGDLSKKLEIIFRDGAPAIQRALRNLINDVYLAVVENPHRPGRRATEKGS